MLYPCAECGHQISSETWRCPNCGREDAGSTAKSVYLDALLREMGCEEARTDPSWMEREVSKESATPAFFNENDNWIIFWLAYYTYFLPLLTTLLWSFYGSITGGTQMNLQVSIAFPGINWLTIVIAVSDNSKNLPALYLLIILAIIGAIVAVITKPTKAQVY